MHPQEHTALRRYSYPPLTSHQLGIVVLVLIAAAQLATATQATSPPHLPSDINQWSYDKPGSANPVRLWDRSTLQNAARVTSYEQMRPMLAKLNAGQPVIVLAFGDSITADHGGCFHRDLELRKRDVAFLQRPDRTNFCNQQPHLAWLTSFMRMINTSWPHPDHLLINLGIPASSFFTIAEGECLELYVPHHADLLILEHLPYLEAPNTVLSAERLLHRLWLHFTSAPPAVIFLNMHQAINSKPGEPQDNCIRNKARCNTECPTSFQGMPYPQSLFKTAELQTHSVASYYGMASLSHPDMIHSLIRDRVAERTGGLSECELFATMYADHVHPSPTGRMLLTDLLVNYLASAEEFFVAQAAEPSHSHKLEGRLLPLQPLDPNSVLVPRMHCFYSAAAPGSDHAGGKAAALPVMNITKAEGWTFVEVEGENGKYKPGWVATTPGSVLWIDLPLYFPPAATHHTRRRRRARALTLRHMLVHPQSEQLQSSAAGGSSGLPGPAAAPSGSRPHPGDTLLIVLTVLRSYKHMGSAEVSCLEGCSCRMQRVDGHEVHLVHSVPLMLTMSAKVTLANTRCILAVNVSSESASGEHKFKVIQASVGALLNMTSALTALALRTNTMP